MDSDKRELNIQNLVENLARLGEDKGELNFWQDMYDKLDRTHKEQLLLNMVKELQDLEKIRGHKS